MASKRLSATEMDEMRKMVVQGVSPEDMSKHFNIAISSVHNYKRRFKQDGLEFPTVRGQRPTGNVTKPFDDIVKELDILEKKARSLIKGSGDNGGELQSSLQKNRAVLKQTETLLESLESSISEYKLTINNKVIEIKGDIANIILKKNSIEIIV